MIGTELRDAQAATHLEPVDLGEHQVEHDEIEDLLVEPVQRLTPVRRLDDVVAFLAQGIREQRLDRLLIVHEQDAR